MRRYYLPTANGFDISHYQIGRDFINDWAGPRLAFSGHVLKLFDLDAYAQLISVEYGRAIPFHNWSYPPSSLALLLPFASLPYGWALAAWTVIFMVAFAVTAMGWVERDRRWIALLLVVFAPASLINLIGGQNGFVTAALLLGGLSVIERRPIAAGVLFGLLTTKPHLGLVLAFALLAMRSWRTILAASLTAAALVGLSVLLFGLEPWRLYLTQTSAYQTQLLVHYQGFYTSMMASLTATLRFNGVPFGAAMIVQATMAIGAIGATCWAIRRTPDPAMRAFIIVAATPLATPYAFNYDLTALSAMLAWRLTRRDPPGPTTTLVYLMAWLAPSAGMLGVFFNVGVMGVFPLLAFAAAVGEVVITYRAEKPVASLTHPEAALCTP